MNRARIRRNRWASLPLTSLGLAAFTACAAPLPPRLGEDGPGLPSEALAPRTLNASSPTWPSWLDAAEHGRPTEVGFVGRAEAGSLEEARALAMRDLYGALSTFLSVAVESESRDQAESSGAGEQQSIFERTRTRSSAVLEGVAADASYWEEVAPAGIDLGSSQFRYFVRARPSPERLLAQQTSARARRSARGVGQVVAILPFAAGAEADPAATLGSGLASALGERLARESGLELSRESSVRAALGRAVSPREQVPRVLSALAPDRLITGLVRRDRDQLRLHLAVLDADGRPLYATQIDRPTGELGSLPGLAARAVLGHLRAQPGPEPNAPPPLERPSDLEQSFYAAKAAYAAGDNDQALSLLRALLTASPEDPAALRLLGRIFERTGRYGRIPPSKAVLAQRAADVPLCSATAQAALARAEADLAARAARLERQAAAQGPDAAGTVSVEEALCAALPRPIGGGWGGGWGGAALRAVPRAGGGVRPREGAESAPVFASARGCSFLRRAPTEIDSAVEAYLSARMLLEIQGAPREQAELDLDLADLARRVDRLDEAHTLYGKVEAWAGPTGALDLASRAGLGQGLVLRQLGNLDAARTRLLQALRETQLRADQPLLLELYNELGGLEVEAGHPGPALDYLEAAWRLAAEQEDAYLKAVLMNNLGVLELRQGHLASARERFERAERFLSNLGEQEGRSAATLNLGWLRLTNGAVDAALAAFDVVGGLAERSQQEGWLAQVQEKRGALWTRQGDPESLYALGQAYLIYQGQGRAAKAERLLNALWIAELEREERSSELLDCLKWRYWEVGTPVFLTKGAEAAPTLATLPAEALTEPELTAALNAAALSGLSDWRAPSTKVWTRPPPRLPRWLLFTPPTEAPDLPRPESRPPSPSPRPSDQPIPTTATADENRAVPGSAEAAGARPRAEPSEPEAVEKPATQDRILGAFTADAELYLLLDPGLLAAHHDLPGSTSAMTMLAAALRHAEVRQHPKAHAVALLDLAAYTWWSGQAETAYALFNQAQAEFAAMGDVYGLAHTAEWLGYLFLVSDAPDFAVAQLEIAHQLYRRLGHTAAAARVRAYAR